MQLAIVEYLQRSGCVPQSIERIRPELPRWERRLRARGVSEIPLLESRAWTSPVSARAHNELALLIRQASLARESAVEHQLRNLTGVRPYKP